MFANIMPIICSFQSFLLFILRQAFDKMPHNNLASKIETHGIRGKMRARIQSWVSDMVVVNSSDWRRVYSGVHRIIETLQCRKRPFGPSSLHRPQSHPGPIPIIPHIYPTNSPDTRVNLAKLHTFGLWKETRAPGGNPHRHGENVQTPHRQ